VLAVVPTGALRLGDQLVATSGSWTRTNEGAQFAPRFPGVPGTDFVVLGQGASGEQHWRELARVSVPPVELLPTTIIESIDPAGETIPANLLRFSVSFSAPIEEGSATGRIRLLDEAGTVMPGTLLDMPPELWDRSRRRLTVLLEPGRIKRGLQPNVQAGPPLRENSAVTLEVDSAIRDAGGATLAVPARRTYLVGPPVRSRVDPALWSVLWPSETAASLVVRFDRPLDRSLVGRCLRVRDERGDRIPGHAWLDEDALEWRFAPTTVAATQHLRLHIDTVLEDLAGNSVRRVFDRDLDDPADDGIAAAELVLSGPRK